MEIMDPGYWYSVMEEGGEETEVPGASVDDEVTAPGGAEPGETVDPDFTEVSLFLRENNESPSPTPEESIEPSSSPGTESANYVPYLENISIQLGVIDIVLVLALLIYVIRQFVRVPR